MKLGLTKFSIHLYIHNSYVMTIFLFLVGLTIRLRFFNPFLASMLYICMSDLLHLFYLDWSDSSLVLKFTDVEVLQLFLQSGVVHSCSFCTLIFI